MKNIIELNKKNYGEDNIRFDEFLSNGGWSVAPFSTTEKRAPWEEWGKEAKG